MMELKVLKVTNKKEYRRFHKNNLILFFMIFGLLGIIVACYRMALFMVSLVFIGVLMIFSIYLYKRNHYKVKEEIICENGIFTIDGKEYQLLDVELIEKQIKYMQLYFEDSIVMILEDYGIKEFFEEDVRYCKINYILMSLLGLVMSYIVYIIFGIIFSFVLSINKQLIFIDEITLYLDALRLAISLAGFVLALEFRKSKGVLIVPFVCLILTGSYVLAPKTISYLNEGKMAYRIFQENLEFYDHLAIYYGRKVATIEHVNDYEIIDVDGITVVKTEEKIHCLYFGLPHQSLDEIKRDYQNTDYMYENYIVHISNESVEVNDVDYDYEMIAYNTLVLKYQDRNEFLLKIYNKNSIKGEGVNLYFLDKNLNIFLERYYPDELAAKNEEEERIESVKTKQEALNLKNYDATQTDEDKINRFNELVKKDNIAEYLSEKGIIKITSEETDIYKVIYEIDREFSRISNDIYTSIDTQILSIKMTSMTDDIYGVEIWSRSDYSNKEKETKQYKIKFKKYKNNYIAIKLLQETVIDDKGIIDNPEVKDTSMTTDYLYRIEGHEIGENAW